jgi:guanine deaminase
MTTGGEIFRAAIFHTPLNPFREPDALRAHDDGGLLVRDGRIAAVGDFEEVRRAAAGAGVRDWRGGVLLPGFVDAHVHFPQLRIIGALGFTLLDWLDRVALPEEARMADERYAAETAKAFVRALAAHGTTSALVFGSHFAPATAALFEAGGAIGLRLTSGLVVSDRALRPELHRLADEAYRDSAALIGRYHGRGRLRYAVTPRFALSCSEPLLEICGALAREHEDVRVQSHINENPDEIAAVREAFPWAQDYFAVYERYGLVGTRTVLAHDVHPTAGELQRLAASGMSIAHCPASNAALGSGLFPLRRHVDAGVRVALGTDAGGGIGVGILKEALQAYLLQRVRPDGPTLDAARMLYLSTLAGAEALGLDRDIGSFAPSKAADFVYLRPPEGSVLEIVMRHASDAAQALTAIFTLAGAESVREVRVGGEVVHAMGTEAMGNG